LRQLNCRTAGLCPGKSGANSQAFAQVAREDRGGGFAGNVGIGRFGRNPWTQAQRPCFQPPSINARIFGQYGFTDT